MRVRYLPLTVLWAGIVEGAVVRRALPTVDLGYAIHQGTINTTGAYYNFSNIRYGQAPVGPLRFSPPLSPEGRNTTINNGQHSVICPQAGPGWTTNQLQFFLQYFTGGNTTRFLFPPSNSSTTFFNASSLKPPTAETSEDCLFLDVVVPQSIFNSAQKDHGPYSVNCDVGKPCRERPSGGAAVMVQIYGGGYTEGDKISVGNPAGLIARSQENGTEGVIYVALNYRLGLFGWLSGDPNVTANAGLLDQRLALDWVQQNIHHFGGDPNRVTVFGESAGGGSIMHHITAHGGNGTIPFQQAIPQSPGFFPYVPSEIKRIFGTVLGNASLVANKSITSADELRDLSFEELYSLNQIMVGQSSYGQFQFGPVVDPSPNSYVPDLPGRLLVEGKYHKLPVLIGHNTNEGLLFTPPFVQTQDEFMSFIAEALPTTTKSQQNELATELYPDVYNGTYGYTTPLARTALTISDLAFTCNAFWLSETMEQSYAYLFSIPPGIHGEDIPYTFFNGDTSTLDLTATVVPNVAIQLQRYLTSFAINGVPTGIELYSDGGMVTNVNRTGLGSELKDPAARSQCQFWQEAPYLTL